MEERKKSKGAVSTVGIMMVITLMGKVLGLVRDRLLTINYGSGMEANAFLTASRIPRVFFDTVFASAISASLIPVFSQLLRKKGRREAMDFAGNFITVMTLLCAVITALGMVFSGELSSFFADGYDSETLALCTRLTRIMMPTVLFTGIAFSFVGILQSMEEFNIPAAISLVSNGGIIAYYLFFNEKFGIEGLAAAFLVAWLLQVLVQVPSLYKKGFYYKPSLSVKNQGMRQVFSLMLPVMVSTWVLPINQTINSKYGSRLFEGAGVSAVELAYNLFTVIAGVFVLSVTNYIFPRLSRENADGDKAAFKKTISKTLRSTMFVVLPMTAGLFVMAKPIVSFIYGGGEFDEFSVSITSRALRYMSLGMIGYAGQAVLCRVYFAGQEGKVPLIAGACSIFVNIVLCSVLTPAMDVGGIALASAASFAVNGIVMAIPLGRRGMSFMDKEFTADMAKDSLAAVIMGLGAYGVRLATENMGKLISLALPCMAGVVIYGAATAVLNVSETKIVLGFVRRAIRRGE